MEEEIAARPYWEKRAQREAEEKAKRDAREKARLAAVLRAPVDGG